MTVIRINDSGGRQVGWRMVKNHPTKRKPPRTIAITLSVLLTAIKARICPRSRESISRWQVQRFVIGAMSQLGPGEGTDGNKCFAGRTTPAMPVMLRERL